MRYYAEYDENKKLICVGIGLDGEEITEDEYNLLLNEIHAKGEYIDRVYYGEIAIEDVPAEMREDVQTAVDERIKQYGAYDPDVISDEEALAIITGVKA